MKVFFYNTSEEVTGRFGIQNVERFYTLKKINGKLNGSFYERVNEKELIEYVRFRGTASMLPIVAHFKSQICMN